MITPLISADGFETFILFLILANGGLVSGGAAGPKADRESSILRALSELSRHAICAKKIIEGTKPETFYERRLEYMVMKNASEQLFKRLGSSGDRVIFLPKLRFDDEVKHAMQDLVVVHRCYFFDQPVFIGGKLERLCL